MQLTSLWPRRRREAMQTLRDGADLAAVARRIAGLIDGPVTEALAVMLTELYGDALSRICAAIERAPDGARILEELGADGLVGGLLVVHDLHPQSIEARIDRALELLAAREAASAYATLDRVENDIAYVRFGGANAALRNTIANAIVLAAPEIAHVSAASGIEDDRTLRA